MAINNQWIIEHNKRDCWWDGISTWVNDKDEARWYNFKEDAEAEILENSLDAYAHNEG